MKKLVALLITLSMIMASSMTVFASTDKINTSDYVTYEYINLGSQVVVTLTNISKTDVTVSINPTYYDSNKKEVIVYSKDINTFEAGKTAIITFDNPKKCTDIKVDVTVFLNHEYKGISASNTVSYYSVYDAINKNILFILENNSGGDLKLLDFSIVFYKGGNIVKVSQRQMKGLQSYYSILVSEKDNFSYDTYKVNINDAYN